LRWIAHTALPTLGPDRIVHEFGRLCGQV
jgi:hypothetical protein